MLTRTEQGALLQIFSPQGQGLTRTEVVGFLRSKDAHIVGSLMKLLAAAAALPKIQVCCLAAIVWLCRSTSFVVALLMPSSSASLFS